MTAKLLTWEYPTAVATAVMTTCKRYSCSKVTVGGARSYELWTLAPGGPWFRQLATRLESFEKAKEIAEEHARKDPARAAA